MKLQKEWLDKAEKNAHLNVIDLKSDYEWHEITWNNIKESDKEGYLQGAAEMLKAVETLVNKKLNDNKDEFGLDEIHQSQIDHKLYLLQDLLHELKSINPLTDV